jgi:hypothetical protein
MKVQSHSGLNQINPKSKTKFTHDLNPTRVQPYQFAFGLGISGLGFDATTLIQINTMETIK